MKKYWLIISVGIVVSICCFCLAFYFFNSKSDDFNSINHGKLVQSLVKQDLESANLSLGPLFLKHSLENGLTLEEATNKLRQSNDYIFIDQQVIDKKVLIRYKILVDEGSFDFTVTFSRQPKVYLVEMIQIDNEIIENKIITSNKEISDISKIDKNQIESNKNDVMYNFDETRKIIESIATDDFDYVFSKLANDYGKEINLSFESPDSLRNYIVNEISFVKGVFKSYMIVDHYTSEDDEYGHIVRINEGDETFHIVVLYESKTSDVIKALYVKEVDEAKVRNQLFNLGYYYKKLISNETGEVSEDYTYNNKVHYNSSVLLGALSLEKMKKRQNKLIYASHKRFRDNSMTFDEFNRYIELMFKRAGVEKFRLNTWSISDLITHYDIPFYRVSNSTEFRPVENLTEYVDVYGTRNIATVYIDLPEKITKIRDINDFNDQIESVYISREIMKTILTNDVKDYEIENSGSSSLMSQAEVRNACINKAEALIKALKARDYQYLWEVESLYSGFDDLETFKEFVDLQEKYVEGFNGVYRIVREYVNTSSAKRVIEYAYESEEGHLKSIIISYDYDNNIIDYNLTNISTKGTNDND